MLFLQMFMVGVVLVGFSLPYALQEGWSVPFTIPRGHVSGNSHGKDDWLHGFTMTHAEAMWLIIPPVIAAMFCTYSMFAFIALLHLLDIMVLKQHIAECAEVVGRFYNNNKMGRQNSGALNDTTSEGEMMSCPGSNESQELQAIQNGFFEMQMEDNFFKVITTFLLSLVSSAQGRIDNTCACLSGLWAHLVLFSTCQVIAILQAAIGHVGGSIDQQYTWWYAFQDWFHLGGGLVLLLAAMGVFCVVTAVFQQVPHYTIKLLGKVSCPEWRMGSIVGLLMVRPLGMHAFWGTIYIDVAKAVGFFLVIFSFVLQSAIYVVNNIDSLEHL